MAEQKYFYVVLLSTPFRTGKFIRAVTKYPYNHAAISLSPEIRYVYSFSRHYKGAAFYGGFTKESMLRYDQNGNIATMKICAVPVTEEQYLAAEKEIGYFLLHSEDTLYNLISAACFPFRKRVDIENSYTCVEFVLNMLRKYADVPGLSKDGFCSIKELSELLDGYKIYEGSAEKFLKDIGWEDDTFPIKKSLAFYIGKTFSNNAKLIKRFLGGTS